jgi:hypothetical protein
MTNKINFKDFINSELLLDINIIKNQIDFICKSFKCISYQDKVEDTTYSFLPIDKSPDLLLEVTYEGEKYHLIRIEINHVNKNVFLLFDLKNKTIKYSPYQNSSILFDNVDLIEYTPLDCLSRRHELIKSIAILKRNSNYSELEVLTDLLGI